MKHAVPDPLRHRSWRRPASRAWCAGLLLAVFALFGSTTRAAPVACPLESFEAHYTLYNSGLPVGKALISLEKFDDGRYQMRSHISSSGLVSLFVNDEINESVNGWVRGGVPQPVSYLQAHTGGDLDHISDASFDWNAGSAKMRYNGRRKTVELKARMVDPLSMYALLMSDLKAGLHQQRYRIANRARLKTYWLKHHGHEKLSTGMGKLNAWKITRTRKKSKRLTSLWFAEDYDFLPAQIVHMVNGREEFRITLKSVAPRGG